ncbi:MAG: ParA family protein [Rubrivivax sp.]|nr:ParA family protein [Rubrivivax sp.]
MPVIVVANPKGGCGKSTLATNLAGLLARRGHAVMLGDVDQQQSSRQWLALRPPGLPGIQSWDLPAAPGPNPQVLRPPKGTTHVVLDTPAGLSDRRLDVVLQLADRLLVPVQPSLFDIQATHAFIEQLLAHPRAQAIAIGLVAMRVRENTIANDRLQQYLATVKLPLVAQLRDTQNYVHLAAHGLTVWDVTPSRVERDLEQWLPLAQWVLQ